MKKTKVSQGVQKQGRVEAMEKAGRHAVRSKRSPLLDEDELFERARRAWLRSCDIPIQPQNDRRISADGNTITLSNINGTLAVYRASGKPDRVVVRQVPSSGAVGTGRVAKLKSSTSAVPVGSRRLAEFSSAEKSGGGARGRSGDRAQHAQETLARLREVFADNHRNSEARALIPLIQALDDTGWIVTTTSSSSHDGTDEHVSGVIEVAVRLEDVGRLATLLKKLQLEDGDETACTFECLLVFEHTTLCPCCVAKFDDVAFFAISVELWGEEEGEGQRQLSSLAELIAKVA